MDQHEQYGEIVGCFYQEQKDIFEHSEQGMYVFLDDDCRVCNDKFATILGYSSAEEWAQFNVQGSFPDAFVDPKSHITLISAYQNAMKKGVGSANKVTWNKKSGGTVETTVILVPVLYKGHQLALHFVF